MKRALKATAPNLTPEQLIRRKKILNSSDPSFEQYGHKMSELEKLAKNIFNQYQSDYETAVIVFENLISSHIHEEKFLGILYLNQFKKSFTPETVFLFQRSLTDYCDCWAICDSTIIKVVGPYLGKKGNDTLAYKTIEVWSHSENLWIRRASMVILLKFVLIKKTVEKDFLFKLVHEMLRHDDEYIQKGIGWLLKTCSRHEPELIFNYLKENKDHLPRLILRYASEKLTKEERKVLLEHE